MGALDACEASGRCASRGDGDPRAERRAHPRRVRGAHGFRAFRDRGLALRRPVLDSILLERARAAGADVREGSRLSQY